MNFSMNRSPISNGILSSNKKLATEENSRVYKKPIFDEVANNQRSIMRSRNASKSPSNISGRNVSSDKVKTLANSNETLVKQVKALEQKILVLREEMSTKGEV